MSTPISDDWDDRWRHKHKPKPVPTPTTGVFVKTTVSIINESTKAADTDVQKWTAAWQKQVTNDFAPVWGADAELVFVPAGQKPDPTTFWLVGLDNSDQAGALGYHDLTPQGLPIGKFFIGTDLQYGYNPSVTGSHELLEMLGDPGINKVYQGPDGNFYAGEVADAPEADQYGYVIDGVTVSDFVYPSWFGGVVSTPYDHQGTIKGPLQLLPGGYIGVWTPNTGWTQKTAETVSARHAYTTRPQVGSRRERRRVGQDAWVPSEPRGERWA